MGCVTSKKAVSVTPAADSSGVLQAHRCPSGRLLDVKEIGVVDGEEPDVRREMGFRLGNFHKCVEGEQVAAGWPAWLSAVAGEAVQGWVPLKADSFEKLDKIGQGTYSSVYRARDLDLGKMVALKKVRFDNFEPESIRFMAREIQILRKLNHPNIIKLEGLIISQFSYSLYLVFEYMEHDLAGLSSSADIIFSESQIKCYMKQLLSALDYCHSHGVIHRDIKGANLLVNNEGILKVADFGLANFCHPGQKQPLTSRVVTLWYRPPELLLGSTDYEATVDLWSVGCVFAEMFVGTPILPGRTEVEQLHKIFKLCGSPSEEYWRNSKLPHSTIFKPHRPYTGSLHEAFQSLPASVFGLLEILLSVESHRRGTASSALASEYFRTKPYACEPSSLPKYPPTKEIDIKNHEESYRKKADGGGRGSGTSQKSSNTYASSQDSSKRGAHHEELGANTCIVEDNGVNIEIPRVNGDARLFVDLHPMPNINCPDEARHMKHVSHGDIPFSGPLHVTASSGFVWVKNPKESNPYVRSNSWRNGFRRLDSGRTNPPKDMEENLLQKRQVNHDRSRHVHKRLPQLEHQESFCASDAVSSKDSFLSFQDDGDRVEYSGPLLSQPHKVDELLRQRERHIRRAVRRSWFHRVSGRKRK